MAGRTFLASWQSSATRSHACAMWARVTRAPWSPNVRAISKHCCARRRYSSALLATIPLPVRPVDDKRSRRGSAQIRACSGAANRHRAYWAAIPEQAEQDHAGPRRAGGDEELEGIVGGLWPDDNGDRRSKRDNYKAEVDPPFIRLDGLGYREQVDDDPQSHRETQCQPNEVARSLVYGPKGLALGSADAHRYCHERTH